MAVHHHGHDSTIVEQREGPATALIVLVVAVLVGFLIWLFGFSGVVFDRNPGSTTRIEQNNNTPQDQTNQQPGNQVPQPGNT